MAITYPLALPAGKTFARIRLAARAVVGLSASPFTLQQQVQAFAGQAWGAEVQLPPMVRADAEAWVAFLLALNGREGTFLLGDPAGTSPRGVATGTPLVAGAGQSGRVLATDGWTPTVTGILKAGDYFQLGSGATARLHKVVADAASDGAGAVDFDIWPALREAPADNAPLTLVNTVGRFRLADNVASWDIGEARLYGLAFGAMEALP